MAKIAAFYVSIWIYSLLFCKYYLILVIIMTKEINKNNSVNSLQSASILLLHILMMDCILNLTRVVEFDAVFLTEYNDKHIQPCFSNKTYLSNKSHIIICLFHHYSNAITIMILTKNNIISSAWDILWLWCS